MKVLIALSGGVDSSVAASLLKENGYNVAGATMLFRGVMDEDIEYARGVTRRLDIPFYLFDFTEIYQKEIIGNFIKEYHSGRTPNPCVLCNQLIKFGLFLKEAEEKNFDKIATGHYARIEEKNGFYLLKRGRDKNEQSYFLYRLNQAQLSKMVLPLGEWTKDEVRKLATKLKLPTSQRRKSQDVCFLPDTDYVSYLKKILPEKRGPIYDKNGKKLGEHKGIFHYTYGQRRGIGISYEKPYYVIRIDAVNNALYVGERGDVYKRKLIASYLNFLRPIGSFKELEVFAKARYYAPLARAKVCLLNDDKARVSFEKPQWALTPGQSVVFYEDDTLLGGGIIEEVMDD